MKKTALSVLVACLASRAQATTVTVIAENFDGGAVNSVYNFTQMGSNFGGAVQASGGSNGNAATLTTNTGSNHNTIAWNSVAIPSGITSLTLSFDFYMTDDTQSICCSTAADGIGFGLVPNAVAGSATGGVAFVPNIAPNVWERPRATGALMFGLDIWDSGGGEPGGGNSVNVSLNGTELDNQVPAAGLINDNRWHRITFTATANGANSLLSATLIRDVNGTPSNEPLFTNLPAPGVDINALGGNYRLIGGGRTGGASTLGRIDNVSLTAQLIPEPATASLAGLAGLFLMRRRRQA
jgi:hypothetical protein